MKNRIALAIAGLLALAIAPSAAHAAACANGATNGYATKLADGTTQCVAAVVLQDGRIVQLTSPVDQLGAPISPALASLQTTGNNTLASILSGMATGTNQATMNTALGAPADTAYGGSGSASHTAALKGIYAQLALILAQQTSETTANGGTGDTAYAGTGSASEIAALKGLYAQLGTLLAANGGVADAAYAGSGSASEIAALKGLYAQLGSLIGANGAAADAAYAGSGNASQVAALKGIYAQLATIVGQAAPTSTPGSSINGTTPVPGFQGVTGGVPMPVDIVIRSAATPRSTILPVQEASDTIASGGTGNAINDVLTVVGGTSTSPAKCTVTAVSSGAVTACAPLSGSFGSYTALPSNPVSVTSGGSGSGATLNIAWAGLALTIAPQNLARRGLHIQPQGGVAYLRGAGAAATADYNSLKINADALYETSPAWVGTGALSMITAGTVPLPVFAAEY